MLVISAVLRELMAAGLTGEDLISAVERVEAASIAVVEKETSQAAIRQRRYREKKRAESVTCYVTEHNNPSQSVTNHNEALQEISPSPEQKAPIPPKTQTSPPKEKNPKGFQKKGGNSDEKFDEFWKVYPKRAGNNSRKEAAAKFTTKLKQGHEPDEIIAGAARYAAFCDQTGKTGTEYVKTASVWINQQLWESDYRITGAGPPRQTGNVSSLMNAIRDLTNEPTDTYDSNQYIGHSFDNRADRQSGQEILGQADTAKQSAPLLDFNRSSAGCYNPADYGGTEIPY